MTNLEDSQPEEQKSIPERSEVKRGLNRKALLLLLTLPVTAYGLKALLEERSEISIDVDAQEQPYLGNEEAAERSIDAQQWLDLAHIAETIGESKEWIDKTFDFPGDGTIVSKKWFDFRGFSITALPKNLKVEFLDCSGTPLTSLPAGLEADILIINYTHITELPKDLKTKDLHAIGCKALSTQSDSEVNIGAQEQPDLTNVEEEAAERSIDAQQWLDLAHIAETIGESKEWIDKTFDFPGDGTIVAKTDVLNFSGSSITALPKNLKATYLDCSFTPLSSLPAGLEAHILKVDSTSITKLPGDLKVTKDLSLTNCKELASISVDLNVADALVLTQDLNPTVIKQAEEWQEQGRQRGSQGIGLVLDPFCQPTHSRCL